MQAWVRNLSLVAVGAIALVWMLAGTPALAYEDPTPHQGNAFKAWNPQYTTMQFARKWSNEGGPVELPHPIEEPPQSFSTGPGAVMTSVPGDGGKSSASLSPGALPAARGAGGMLMDAEAQAERRVQQVIRRLG